MTTLLCLEDSYLRECHAIVVSADGPEIELDRTVFYPRGGGQPSDTGFLSTGSAPGFRVQEVLKKDGKVVHVLGSDISGLKTGEKIRCVIDWERRYNLMRMHTAAHVLGATIYDDLHAQITGNQLDTDKTRFDFNLENFNREAFDQVVAKVNGLLLQDIRLKIYSLPRDEALKLPGVVKLAGALPPSIEQLRIVEIPGIDLQADGGTHVRNLKEVGQVQIIKLENKGKSNRRIYFTLSNK